MLRRVSRLWIRNVRRAKEEIKLCGGFCLLSSVSRNSSLAPKLRQSIGHPFGIRNSVIIETAVSSFAASFSAKHPSENFVQFHNGERITSRGRKFHDEAATLVDILCLKFRPPIQPVQQPVGCSIRLPICKPSVRRRRCDVVDNLQLQFLSNLNAQGARATVRRDIRRLDEIDR